MLTTDNNSPSDVVLLDIRVEEVDNGGALLLTFDTPYEFESHAHLFQSIRDVLSSYYQGKFLMIKYAARIHCSNMPVIHDPADLVIFIDPLQTVRDPLQDIAHGRPLKLLRLPSQSYYYRKKQARVNVNRSQPDAPISKD